MITDGSLLRLRKLAATFRGSANWRDDEALTVGRELEIRFHGDPEQLQDGLVDNDPGTIADGLKTLRHDLSINIVHNGASRADFPNIRASQSA